MNFSPTPYRIFFMQIFCTICVFVTLIFFSWQYIVLSIAAYCLYAGLGVALTFHRTLAHKSWIFPPVTKKILITLASLANVGSPVSWVAIHREHHRFSDTNNDPLSPEHRGFWYVMYGTVFGKPSLKYSADLLRDEFCSFIHKYYYLIQVPLIVLLFFIGGIKAVIAIHFAGGGIAWISASVVNYFNHIKIGYTNFETRDNSRNNLLTGFIVFGEGWHNNHHYSPGNPSTKEKWWEFDPLYLIGSVLGKPNKEENK
jgi:fatty-acid desaturase